MYYALFLCTWRSDMANPEILLYWKQGNYTEIFAKRKKVWYIFCMNDELLKILIRVNADITLSNDIKEVMTSRLQNCASEEEFIAIKNSLESYWESVDPIIQAALARKSPEELIKIEQSLAQMISGTHKIVESAVQKNEFQEAESIISSF